MILSLSPLIITLISVGGFILLLSVLFIIFNSIKPYWFRKAMAKLKREGYFLLKKVSLSNIIYLLIIIGVFIFFYFKKQAEKIDSLVNAAVVLGILIAAVANAIAAIIVFFSNRIFAENARIDYLNKDLCQIYSRSNLFEDTDKYPIADLIYLNNRSIKIDDDKDKFYELPSIIQSNSKGILEAYKVVDVYNSINIRLDDIIEAKDTVTLKLSRSQYYYSLLTNRAPDYELDSGISIREAFEPGPYLMDLNKSKLSNHLGFNGFVLTSDNKIPFILRSNKVSIGKKTLANSIGASLKVKYAVDKNKALKDNPFGESIIHEIYDELNVSSIDGFKDMSVEESLKLSAKEAERDIICFYRDLVECGKPQFLFFSKINLSSIDINTSIKKKPDAKENRSKHVLKDGNKVILFDLEDVINNIEVGYDYIRVKGKKKKYYMMPSAAACTMVLISYLRNQKNN